MGEAAFGFEVALVELDDGSMIAFGPPLEDLFIGRARRVSAEVHRDA
jgi:hypothetical protein